MSELKNGRKPIRNKQQAEYINEEELFGNPLKLPPSLEAELKAAGLEWRFIDSKKLYQNHGYHDKGWTPYKRDASETTKADFKEGADPDGVFRRGSLILATKSKEACEKHRQVLRQKADRQKSYNKSKAAELRQMAKESFKDAKKVIYEGYEDEQGTSSDEDFDE